MLRKIVFLISLIILLPFISGCSINLNTGSGTGAGGNDGGVYKSLNKGETWVQKTLMPTASGRPKSFSGVDINSLIFDPSDNKAIYMGSIDNGLFYSYDAAENWQIATSLGKYSISAVAIDTSSKCIIYASIANKLYKSSDCNRNWIQVYFDNDLKIKINAIAVDNFNSALVYIGTSRGEIIKSADRGISWQTLKRFDFEVKEIITSPFDSKIIFIGLKNNGIFRSKDGGENWTDLSTKLKELVDNTDFNDLELSKSDASSIFLATRNSIFKSTDNGDNWKKIELITPEKEAAINSIAVSPKDAKEIYYVTNTTFYRSADGGQKWITKKLPTNRAGWKLLIDPQDTNIIYLGARKVR